MEGIEGVKVFIGVRLKVIGVPYIEVDVNLKATVYVYVTHGLKLLI